MTDNIFIPSLSLDASTVGQEHCFDAWREAVRAVYDVNPASNGRGTAESVKAWLLNGLIFSDVRFSAQSFSHDKKLASHANYLSLQLYRTGSCKGVLEDQFWQMSPGDVHVFDFSRELYSTASEAAVAGVIIPHESIGYDPARHPGHMCFAGDTSVGRFIGGTLLALLDQLPVVKHDDAVHLSKGFCGLVQGILAPHLPLDPGQERNRDDRRKEMRAYLDRNLSASNLGVAHLCRTFNISRPSIYRDFAEHGGVANYITQRRLARAFYQLTSVPFGQRRIKEVANSVGFADPAHFSRLFRQRFGLTPKEASQLGGTGGLSDFRLPVSGNTFNCSQLSAWLQSI